MTRALLAAALLILCLGYQANSQATTTEISSAPETSTTIETSPIPETSTTTETPTTTETSPPIIIPPTNSTQQANRSQISVSGEGDVKSTPDQVQVVVGIQERNVSLQDARTQANAKSSSIISYLKDQGIASKDIQTTYLSVQPSYNNSDDSSDDDEAQPDFYIANKQTTFILRDISKYDEVLSGLYNAGINTIDGITFGLQDPQAPKVEAREKAVKNAKAIANALASALDVSLTGVYSIVDNSDSPTVIYQPQAVFANAAESADSGSSGPSIAGGVVTTSINVGVTFYLSS